MTQHSLSSLVEPIRVTPTDTTVSVLVTSTAVLAANANRKMLVLKNLDATNPVFISLDGDAADTDDMELGAKEGVVLDVCVPETAILAISTGGTVKLYVSEGV